LQQIESQWDAFDPNQSEQLANRRECLPRTERHKDDVTFNGAQVRLGGFTDRPGQVGFVLESLHDYDPLAVRSGSNSQPALVAAKDSHHFPRAGHARATVIRLDLD
jgi:hypothetical protein